MISCDYYSELVVTMATIKDFVATGSSDLASPPVMVAPNTQGREARFIRIRDSPITKLFWIETDLSIDYVHKLKTDENP